MRYEQNTDRYKYEQADLQPFPADCMRDRKTNGFVNSVRDFFLSTLPEVTIKAEVSVIVCPWCLEYTGRHATQVDHIIPKQIYMRYQLYKDKDNLPLNTIIYSKLEEYLHHTDNLLICCNDCNNAKGDDFPEMLKMEEADNFHRRYLTNFSDFERKTRLAREIMSVYLPHGDAVLFDYLARWMHKPLSQGILVNPLLNDGEKQIRSWRAPGANAPFRAFQVIDTLATHQVMTEVGRWTGKVCFYCLGVYQDMAFQIDHIDARLKGQNYEINNSDANLLAVCRGCNAAKSDNPITTGFLIGQVSERIDRGWPGIESADWYEGHNKAQVIRDAYVIQERLLHMHLNPPSNSEVNKFINESHARIKARKKEGLGMQLEE